MNAYAFLDLDDTLFQSKRKCPPDVPLRPAAYSKDGKVSGWMTPDQIAFYEWLANRASIVPTTGRDLSKFRRVKIPFSSYAILDFGGTVIGADRMIDQEWHERITAILDRLPQGILEWHRCLVDRVETLRLKLKFNVISTYDRYMRLDIHQEILTSSDIENLIEDVGLREIEGFYLHHNRTLASLIPEGIRKENAVRYVLEQHLPNDVVTIGIGDSISDLPFMTVCDELITPDSSQISLNRDIDADSQAELIPGYRRLDKQSARHVEANC